MVIFAYQDDFSYLGISTGNEKDVIKLEYSKEDSIDKIVNDIYDTYKYNQGAIDCLFLVGHGNAGVLWLGSGLGPVRSAKFAKLKGLFSAGSRGIEIHGCACASSTDIPDTNLGIILKGGKGVPDSQGKGYEFLQKLAVNSGVKVTAPLDSIWGPNAAYSYKDVRTMTVYPSGSTFFTNC